MFAAERIRQAVDFSGRGLVERIGKFRVETASIQHGRGISYTVALAAHLAFLSVEESDYRAAFGANAYLHPRGYCIQGITRTAGDAIWIKTGNGGKLPAGSLGLCSPPPAPAPRPQPFASSLFRAPPTSAEKAKAWSQVGKGQPNPVSLPPHRLPK